jgi:Arc/MetJ-type ribon-helix-helix transcriptional regulator
MAKATGNISQKPVVVKLNKEQIAVLDMVVANGDYNGRSHAIRELLLPALNAGVTAMNTGSGGRAMITWIKEMKKLTKRMDDVAKNAKNYRTDRDQVELDIGLPPVRIEPLPT